jgi:phosphoglycerate dehydrogenase-like enzyme
MDSSPAEPHRPAARPNLAFAFLPERTRHVFSPAHLARLGEMCRVLDERPLERFDDARARSVLAQTEILVTGWGCANIDLSVLVGAPRLRLIAHAAGTVKTFIAPEVLQSDVKVTHAAAANALPVAEFTLAAILFSNKRVLEFRRLYAEGRPGRIPLMDQPIGNLRKAVGIVGASRIGRRVIELLRPFDFDLLLYDPYVARAEADVLGVTLTGLDGLVATADIVSLHAPSLTATRHMIDARRLRLMRDGATLINTARGRLVDHAALEAELVTGRINAVIDVTEPEILPRTSPLYDLPNVLLTPHIAGALGIERERLGALIVVELERYVRGEPLQHAIEPRALERIA